MEIQKFLTLSSMNGVNGKDKEYIYVCCAIKELAEKNRCLAKSKSKARRTFIEDVYTKIDKILYAEAVTKVDILNLVKALKLKDCHIDRQAINFDVQDFSNVPKNHSRSNGYFKIDGNKKIICINDSQILKQYQVNLKRDDKAYARAKLVYQILTTYGHELSHFLQNDYCDEFTKSLMGNTFPYNKEQAEEIVKSVLKLSDVVETDRSFFTPQKTIKPDVLKHFSQAAYLAYPHEQDARVGGYVYANTMLSEYVNSRKLDKSIAESIENVVNSELKTAGKISRQSVLGICLKSVDFEKITRLSSTLNKVLKQQVGQNGQEYTKFAPLSKEEKLARALMDIGKETFTLYCVHANEKIGDFYRQLIKEGNPLAIQARKLFDMKRNIMTQNNSLQNKHVRCVDMRVFNRKEILKDLTLNEVSPSAFKNIDFLNDDFFSDYQKDILLCTLLKQDKIQYIWDMFHLSKPDCSKYPKFTQAIAEKIDEYLLQIQNQDEKFTENNFLLLSSLEKSFKGEVQKNFKKLSGNFLEAIALSKKNLEKGIDRISDIYGKKNAEIVRHGEKKMTREEFNKEIESVMQMLQY